MTEAGVRVAILTCSELGYETADAVDDLDCVAETTVLRAPPKRPASLRRRMRIALRKHGLAGAFRLAARKLGLGPSRSANTSPPPADRGWTLLRVDRFEDDGLAHLDRIRPDLILVDGTYILPEAVFSRSRLGTVNLHCGALPHFKGAPPAFWEIFEGVPEVGATVHLVTADLDGGPILDARSFPLDTAPLRDPVDYADEVWRTVLRPAGIRMFSEVVRRAATSGALRGTPQEPQAGTTYRSPGHRDVQELRRRVSERRSSRGS